MTPGIATVFGWTWAICGAFAGIAEEWQFMAILLAIASLFFAVADLYRKIGQQL